MKKSLSLFVGLLVAMGAVSAEAATNWGTRAGSSADLSGAPATRTREKVNYEKYQTRTLTKTYEAKDAGDLYYTKPANRSALYKQYEGANSSAARAIKTTKRTTRSEQVVNKMRRKYYLAHPFFQPLGGMFGSITDFSYTMNSYDFTINQTLPVWNTKTGAYENVLNGLGGKWDMTRFAVKEDFSYGITDRIAVLGMLEYDMSDYKFEWDDDSPDDKMDDSGVNLFGLGAQWRFVDNTDWIATASAYFQHQKDVSNNFLIELKGGYKVSKSTIYGLARGWYLDLDGNSYGNGVEGKDVNGNSALMYIPYQVGDSNVMYFEAGLGVFSVLNEDWTLNVEGLFGNYDWHNQASIKGAIGWQPNDWFALNLYVKTAFYDSANDKDLDLYWMEPSIQAQAADGTEFYLDHLTQIGTVKLDNYAETSIGVQAIFQF
ncbi:MAG: hypothetical protein IJD69_00220 [Alphaproteobacteria bacterium]|nr:hypothetical protein [Alphaproteobacteria bacterium]